MPSDIYAYCHIGILDHTLSHMHTPTVFQLWPHESLDRRAEHRSKLMENETWRETCECSVFVFMLAMLSF